MRSLYDDPRYREARKRLHPQPCHYCGKTPAGTIDHVIPIARGGTNDPRNWVPCCQSCNSKRGNAMQKELRRRRGRERNPKW